MSSETENKSCLPPAIGIAVEQQFEQAESLRKEAERIEGFAQSMILEYGIAVGLLDKDGDFTYNRATRKFEKSSPVD